MAVAKDGCVKPSKGPILMEENQATGVVLSPLKEAAKMIARVGKPAPDFELSAFLDGGFKNVKLSDYKGEVDRSLLLSRRFHLCLTNRIVGSCRQISRVEIPGC